MFRNDLRRVLSIKYLPINNGNIIVIERKLEIHKIPSYIVDDAGHKPYKNIPTYSEHCTERERR
jgi:hypothetical protein